VRLAAVPDCGYETVAWSFGDETFEPNPEFWDPTITVVPGNDWGTPGRFTPRLLEVSFAPSTTVRNDCFATPHELPHDGLTGAVEFENATAGFEAGEPMHGGSDGGAGASLWWTFHAPADGELKMWLESDFASILAVYEGSSVTDLDAVASCVSSECREISVPVPEGALLRILVDGVGFREPSDPVLAVGETGWGALFWEMLPVAESEVSVAIDPTTVSLEPGAVQTFTATVKGARDPSVSWWSTCGSLDPSGLMATYTALNEGTCEVTVTSTEDVNAWASAVVTVVASD